jgi:hypothetical protein
MNKIILRNPPIAEKTIVCLTVNEDKRRSPQPPTKPGVEPIVVRVVENEGRAFGAEVGELKSFKE